MSDELVKQSCDIIQQYAEKYLTEGNEPQLDVNYFLNKILF